MKLKTIDLQSLKILSLQWNSAKFFKFQAKKLTEKKVTPVKSLLSMTLASI
jgi:hypothetical protein